MAAWRSISHCPCLALACQYISEKLTCRTFGCLTGATLSRLAPCIEAARLFPHHSRRPAAGDILGGLTFPHADEERHVVNNVNGRRDWTAGRGRSPHPLQTPATANPGPFPSA